MLENLGWIIATLVTVWALSSNAKLKASRKEASLTDVVPTRLLPNTLPDHEAEQMISKLSDDELLTVIARDAIVFSLSPAGSLPKLLNYGGQRLHPIAYQRLCNITEWEGRYSGPKGVPQRWEFEHLAAVIHAGEPVLFADRDNISLTTWALLGCAVGIKEGETHAAQAWRGVDSFKPRKEDGAYFPTIKRLHSDAELYHYAFKQHRTLGALIARADRKSDLRQDFNQLKNECPFASEWYAAYVQARPIAAEGLRAIDIFESRFEAPISFKSVALADFMVKHLREDLERLGLNEMGELERLYTSTIKA